MLSAIAARANHWRWPPPFPAAVAFTSLGAIASAIALTMWFAVLPAHRASPPPAPHARATHPHRAAAPGRVAAKAKPRPSAFALEQQMSFAGLMKRWDPLIAEASKRYGVPHAWIRAVMQAESGGRTMSGPAQPITSNMGAMGLMQLMPQTWAEMRREQGLGRDPYDPHDNVMAGAAYLKWLRGKYGYPEMFAAYNDGPGHLDQRIMHEHLLPLETVNYVARVTAALNGVRGGHLGLVRLTRPNGAPVYVDGAAVRKVRAPYPGEYADAVRTVILVGRVSQGVTETVSRVRAIVRAHGGAG